MTTHPGRKDSPAHVLVTGATGAVGPSVVAALSEAGLQIRTLSRHAPPPEQLPAGIDARSGDIADPAAVQAAVEGVDSVIHLAANLHVFDPPGELRPLYERINVGGTANVVEAALHAGVGRVVFFSTIAVYGTSPAGEALTEDAPLHPDSYYAQTKARAERIVLAAPGGAGAPIGVVLRLGAVYGKRIKGNYRQLLLALAQGRFVPVGRGNNRRTLVYDGDVARAALLALRHPDAAGKIFNVTDGHIHPMHAIIEAISDALGRRPPRLRLPLGPVNGLVGVLEDVGRFCGWRPPVCRATIDKYTEDMAVDGSKFCRELGFTPAYDLKTGWRETIAEMRRSGDL